MLGCHPYASKFERTLLRRFVKPYTCVPLGLLRPYRMHVTACTQTHGISMNRQMDPLSRARDLHTRHATTPLHEHVSMTSHGTQHSARMRTEDPGALAQGRERVARRRGAHLQSPRDRIWGGRPRLGKKASACASVGSLPIPGWLPVGLRIGPAAHDREWGVRSAFGQMHFE